MPPWTMGHSVWAVRPASVGRELVRGRRPRTRIQPAQRPLHPLAGRSYAAWPGTTWSKAIATSAPSAHWMSIAVSGVRSPVLPSTWLDELDPLLARSCADDSSEKTWKPPESVSIGRCQVVKRWRPPSARIDLLTGPEMQMIGVAQDDLGAGPPHLVGVQAADRALGADRHERGRVHRAVRQLEHSGPSEAFGSGD